MLCWSNDELCGCNSFFGSERLKSIFEDSFLTLDANSGIYLGNSHIPWEKLHNVDIIVCNVYILAVFTFLQNKIKNDCIITYN